jgi:prolyl-tRNA synthetase
LIIGANAENSYIIHSNFGRDYDANLVGDICRITQEYQCRHCNSPLEVRRAIKLANILRIGDHYGRCFEHTIRYPDGRIDFPNLGVYGINLTRMLIALVETNRTPRGFVWPMALSPFSAILIPVGWSSRIRQTAEQIYKDHQDLLIFEDRDSSFIEKTKHADRLGIRLRLVVCRAALASQSIDLLDSLRNIRIRMPIGAIRSYLMELRRTEINS